MSGGLDMSLDDIIKSNRKPTGSRGRGGGGNTGGAGGGRGFSGSASGPSRRFANRVGNRTTPYSRPIVQQQAHDAMWQNDVFATDASVAAAFGHQSAATGGGSSIETGTKLHISNLDYGVSNEDIKLDDDLMEEMLATASHQHPSSSTEPMTTQPTTTQPTSSHPTTETGYSCHDPAADIDLTTILNMPSRRLLSKIDPAVASDPFAGTTWFKVTTELQNAMREIFFRDLRAPYPSWTKVPIRVRDRWFGRFAQMYYWDRHYDGLVWSEFDSFGTDNFHGYVSTWKQKWRDGKPLPNWMSNDLKKWYIEFWSSPKSQEKSVTCSTANKSVQEKGEGKHTLGSKPMKRLAHQLHIEKRVKPDIVTLLEASRKSKKTGIIIDKKVDRILTEVKEKTNEILNERSQSHGGNSEICSNELIPEEIQQPVPMTKNFRFGYGSYTDGATSSRMQMPPPVGYVSEDTLRSTQEELRRTQDVCTRLSMRFDSLQNILKEKFNIDLPSISDDPPTTSNPQSGPSYPSQNG